MAVALFMGAVSGLFALRRQHGPAFLRPLLVQLATILPLFTAVLIGVIYYFYAAFYEPFGVTPAEVGLTTQAMLSRQGLFIAAWLVVIVALTLTVYGVLWSVHPLLGVERRLDVLQATLLPLIVAIMVLTVLAGTFERGGELAAAARAGRPYDAFAAWFWWPQVREVEVVTADPGLEEGARLIYLGQADGVSVFYDLRRQSTVRLRDVRQIRDRAPP